MKEAPPRPQRLRRLSDEEIALWTEVARGVERRRGAVLPTPSKPVVAEPARFRRRLRPRRPQTGRRSRPRRRSRRSNGALKRKLARGRGEIDDAIDLHGMNQAEAHQALRGFLRHSQASGARLVIVVTGKGGPLDEAGPWQHERGVLRRLTPHWLREPDLREVSSSASRKRDARMAGPARSTCG